MSWETTKAGYSPEAFYTKSTDDQGHGSVVSSQVPPYIAAQVGKLVESSQWPMYGTKSDVVRDALVHLLVRRAEEAQDQAILKEVRLMIQHQTASSLIQRVSRMQALVLEYRKAMHLTADRGDELALREALYQADEALLMLDQPYRGQLQQVVDEYRTALRRMT